MQRAIKQARTIPASLQTNAESVDVSPPEGVRKPINPDLRPVISCLWPDIWLIAAFLLIKSDEASNSSPYDAATLSATLWLTHHPSARIYRPTAWRHLGGGLI